VYGTQFVTEPRGAEAKLDRFPSLIGELLRSRVDVIVSVAAALPSLKSATSTVPIVVISGWDLVGGGFVQSLSHPGGNITGLSEQGQDLMGKRLELRNSDVTSTERTPAVVAVLKTCSTSLPSRISSEMSFQFCSRATASANCHG
jgi:putative ABC transport system substrate-binding protein